MFPAMACGSAVIARPRVSRGSVGAMLKLGRWLGLVCENCTAVQEGSAAGPLAQALARAAAWVPSPGLPK
jgi:hypothetical protein